MITHPFVLDPTRGKDDRVVGLKHSLVICSHRVIKAFVGANHVLEQIPLPPPSSPSSFASNLWLFGVFSLAKRSGLSILSLLRLNLHKNSQITYQDLQWIESFHFGVLRFVEPPTLIALAG